MTFTAFVDGRVVVVRCLDRLIGWFVEVRVPVDGGVIEIDSESAPISVAHMAESYARMLQVWGLRERSPDDAVSLSA